MRKTDAFLKIPPKTSPSFSLHFKRSLISNVYRVYKKGNRTLEWPSTLQYLLYAHDYLTIGNNRRLAFECRRFGKIRKKIEQIRIK